MTNRQEKKSESLEIRLPYSQKNAFMDACREQGISASEALRQYIETALEPKSPRPSSFSFGAIFNMLEQHRRKLTAGVATGLTAATLAFALPSTAGEGLFLSFDRNGDGVLTEGEISSNDSEVIRLLDKDNSGTVTTDEFKREGEVTSITDNIVGGKDADSPEQRIVTIKTTKFAIGDDGKANIFVNEWGSDVPLDATESDIRNIVENIKTEMADVQSLERMTEDETLARLAEIEARAEAGKEHTFIRLKKLEDIEDAVASLSGINIDIDLSNLESLKELEKLSALAELEGLEELAELESLKDLENIDFDFDFDFSELDTALEQLDAELADMDAEIDAKIRVKIAELSDEFDGKSKVFIVRKTKDEKIKSTDEKDKTSQQE